MKKLYALALCVLMVASLNAEQVLTGLEAQKVVKGAEKVRLKDFTSIPNYIKFYPDQRPAFSQWQQWMSNHYFKSKTEVGFELQSQESDRLGMVHYRYKMSISGIEVFTGMWIVHTLDGAVVSMNGDLFDNLKATSPSLTEPQALNAALTHINAEEYKWEVPAEEAFLKREQNDPAATFYPSAKLCYINKDQTMKNVDLELAYKFDVYAQRPMSRTEVYISAIDGSVIYENDLIHHADSNGVAVTGYSGNQNIVADYTGTQFTLNESGRGNGVNTYNLNNGTSYGNATMFTDADNFWDYPNVDKYATDAHWGAEMTYDYFMLEHNRNSINNNGFALNSYVHYDNNYNNAFWDGSRMTYGDGSGNNSPLTAIDVTGHEIAHGLTTFTANLVYSYESGALNESFSDIFGTCVEFFGIPSQGDWLIGEEFGAFRSMSNPGIYGHPDCYLGNNWWTAPGDNGGVHINSGVQNFWFYLLSEGGSGTNDLGNSYSVNGIGIEEASEIAFRNLTVYLGTNSQFIDARFYALEAAIDLFGVCSAQLIDCGNAWYACGVGGPYASTVDADFMPSGTSSCNVPYTVNFSNMSSNATSYSWNFGDGGTSTQANPSHTYTTAGTYTVVLTVNSTCGTDTKTETSLIEIGPSAPCEVNMPQNGASPVQNSCLGVAFDNGGAVSNYDDNTDATITISPIGAGSVTITFDEFQMEGGGGTACIYDFLEVYDGPSTNSTVLGKFCDSNLPPTSITSSNSSITLRQFSDGGVTGAGFKISWECNPPTAPPTPDFSVSTDQTCDGKVSFFDASTNGASSWVWSFGDGNTSTDQNPTHTYTAAGTYNVKLVVANSLGSDSITVSNVVTVDFPPFPVGDNVEICPGESADLIGVSTGESHWYDVPTGGNALHVGDTFTTPIVMASTPYYVENLVANPAQTVGALDNNIGSGNFFNNEIHHLKFDAFKEFELVSVRVFAGSEGVRVIQWRDDQGNVMDQKTVNIPQGEQIINLNFNITPGVDYELGLQQGSTANLYRNNSGPNYPYEIEDMVSITRSSAGTAPFDYYYFFYDWQVRDFCLSPRKEIFASTGECTGIEEFANSRMSVFPNPAEDVLTVRVESSERVLGVIMTTTDGRMVEVSSELSGSQASLQVSDLAAGVYFIRVQTNTQSYTEQVVIR